MGDQLFLLFTPKHSISRKTNGAGETIDLHKVNHRPGATWTQSLDELIGHDLNADFSKIVAAVWMGKHALVPQELFQEKNQTALYELDNVIREKCSLHNEAMLSNAYQVIFNVPDDLKAQIVKRFPNTKITSGFNFAAKHWKAKDAEVARIFLHLFEEEFSLTCFDEGEMIFQNHYNYYSAEDVLYYCLIAAKQYDFNLSELPVYLTGHIEKEGKIIETLRKYLPGVQIPSVPKAESSRNILQGNPQQYYHIFSLK